jgi:hypothetical protein
MRRKASCPVLPHTCRPSSSCNAFRASPSPTYVVTWRANWTQLTHGLLELHVQRCGLRWTLRLSAAVHLQWPRWIVEHPRITLEVKCCSFNQTVVGQPWPRQPCRLLISHLRPCRTFAIASRSDKQRTHHGKHAGHDSHLDHTRLLIPLSSQPIKKSTFLFLASYIAI